MYTIKHNRVTNQGATKMKIIETFDLSDLAIFCLAAFALGAITVLELL